MCTYLGYGHGALAAELVAEGVLRRESDLERRSAAVVERRHTALELRDLDCHAVRRGVDDGQLQSAHSLALGEWQARGNVGIRLAIGHGQTVLHGLHMHTPGFTQFCARRVRAAAASWQIVSTNPVLRYTSGKSAVRGDKTWEVGSGTESLACWRETFAVALGMSMGSRLTVAVTTRSGRRRGNARRMRSHKPSSCSSVASASFPMTGSATTSRVPAPDARHTALSGAVIAEPCATILASTCRIRWPNFVDTRQQADAQPDHAQQYQPTQASKQVVLNLLDPMRRQSCIATTQRGA